MIQFFRGWTLGTIAILCIAFPLYGSNGSEGASFLDIPVGARPAALGGAYTALALDAYAPTWNPAGLAHVQSDSLATQYLSYLESIQYEYLSYVHPIRANSSLGASIQYMGTGSIAGTDGSGNPIGDFSSHYGAYSLAYGQSLTDKLSLGLNGKWINAKISDVSANAFAVDLGGFYNVNTRLSLASTLTNAGTKLTFLSHGDSLPLAFHFAAAYHLPNLNLSVEEVCPELGSPSFHMGIEWLPLPEVALRGGYRTDTLSGLSPIAGLTLGIGITAWKQEFSYAWLPVGDLGNTQYFSWVLRFGGSGENRRNLVQYDARKTPRTASASSYTSDDGLTQLLDLLSDDNMKVVQVPPSSR